MATYTSNFSSQSELESLLLAAQSYESGTSYTTAQNTATDLIAQLFSITPSSGTIVAATGYAPGIIAHYYGTNLGTPSRAVLTSANITNGTHTLSITGSVSANGGAITSIDFNGQGYSEHAVGWIPVGGESPAILTSWSSTYPTSLGNVSLASTGTQTDSTSSFSTTAVSDAFGHSASISGLNFSISVDPSAPINYVDVFHSMLSESDVANGSSGDNELHTYAGSDTINGGAGNDMIDGGAGIDTSIYTGNRANFTVAQSGTGFIVTDNTGATGTDTMNNIERLSFADGTLAIDTSGTSGQMYRLYKAAFNRTPDAPGLGWNIDLVDGGMTMAQMSAAFVASAEFTSTYGSLTNAQFLDQLYLNVLGRPADAAGAAWNLNLLDTNAVDRSGMLAAYSESAENQAALIGQTQDGIWFT